MALEIDRAALVEHIETVFADGRSGKERAKFVHQLPLADRQALPYEAQELDTVFRNRVWQSVAFEQHEQLHDLDCVTALSDEALAYYLPALLIMAVSDPSWLVNHEDLEQRVIGSFPRCSRAQLDALIGFIDLMVGYYSHVLGEQDTLPYDQPMLDAEDYELRLLLYLDEKRALLKRREG